MLGLVGRKLGMTTLYDAIGEVVHVTVLQFGSGVVVQKKTLAKDGYNALQLGFEEKKEKHCTKPLKGHFAKSKISPKRILKEFRLDNVDVYEEGQEISLGDLFKNGQYVDVSGVSKGKGYAGVIKKHKFHRGPESHGSRHHREPGSVGAMGVPRVWLGRKLAGRMGHDCMTVQNLKVIKVDSGEGLLYVKGAVPGSVKDSIVVKNAVKKINQSNAGKK